MLWADELVLRPWRDSDADAAMTAFAVPDLQRWHMRRIDSADEARGWIACWTDRWHANTDASWAITRVAEDEVLGCVSLRTVMPAAATAQLSWWTLPRARRSGVASAGARAVAQWAFTTLGLHRLFAVHSIHNEPSCRVARRAGFALEGTLRDYMLHDDGWHDVHMHARLASDVDVTSSGR